MDLRHSGGGKQSVSTMAQVSDSSSIVTTIVF